MDYSIKNLSELAGISTRTLRYYDHIGLLTPGHIQRNGYRVYRQKEVDILQEILFYRELGLKLVDIKQMIQDPKFDSQTALMHYQLKLIQRKETLDILIKNVEMTLQSKKGLMIMNDKEKFEGFKEDLIKKNEIDFGDQVRKEFGSSVVDESNRKLLKLTKEDFDKMNQIDQQLKFLLEKAVVDQADPTGKVGETAALLHKEWLGYTWSHYSPQAHAGLVEMYLEDERFKDNLDKHQSGCAEFLKKAVLHWLKA